MNQASFTRPWLDGRWMRAVALIGTVALAACGDSGGDGVTIKGDVAGLDSLALRGDSLLAQAGRPAVSFDSLPRRGDSLRVASGEGTLVVSAKDGLVGTDIGNAMSRRAQARGDSMARAVAANLAATAGGRSRGDTVRGVLELTGPEPARQLMLRRPDGVSVSLSGMATTGLSKLVGTELEVHGVQVTPRDVVMTDYVVRSANGNPAYDGTIEQSGSLRLTDGSGNRRVPLPASLRTLVGARVWVAVKNGAAVTGGVIATR